MRIIFEGPDGAGKTMLLGDMHGRAVEAGENPGTVHHGPYKGKSTTEVYNLYRMSLERGNYLDRSWISEMIYAPAVRNRRPRLNQTQVMWLDRIAEKMHYVIVFCLPPLDTVMENWSDRYQQDKEYVTDAETVKDIYESYWQMLDNTDEWTRLPVFHYDYTKDEGTNGSLRDRMIRAQPGYNCKGDVCAG